MLSSKKNASLDNIADNLFLFFPLYYRKILRIEHSKVGPKPHNLQVRVLFMLTHAGTTNPSMIGQRMGISKPNVTSTLNKLISSGYVARQHDDRDRRVINIAITEKGMRFVAKKRRMLCNRVKENLSCLQDVELETLNSALETFKNIISKIDEIT